MRLRAVCASAFRGPSTLYLTTRHASLLSVPAARAFSSAPSPAPTPEPSTSTEPQKKEPQPEPTTTAPVSPPTEPQSDPSAVQPNATTPGSEPPRVHVAPISTINLSRPFRWPLFTPLKVNLMLNWLENKDPRFKRDEFLEGAKGAFSTLMERFPPERPERFEEALSPALNKALLEGCAALQKEPLRVTTELRQLNGAEIVNVHFLKPEANATLLDNTGDLIFETAHIEVKFDCVEEVTTKVEVENTQPKILAQDAYPRIHEWTFEGTFRPGHTPQWRLVMI